MEQLKLTRPSAKYLDQISAYRQEFLAQAGSMDGCGSLRTMEAAAWLGQVEQLSRPETTPEGWVPSTQFLYIRESDGRLVGMIQIRHWFNDRLRQFGGHIGYSVRPSERRKGYGTRMLRDCLPHCRPLGLERVLITCRDTNEGSRKIILANGGVYANTVFDPENGENFERYWISVTA
ncbi:MAG: GNAT family N-acetyltransferase [Oscillospiraceae bacterium]|nr:GNAT family N-acetyltransferase [Oscillospiraceae bacterium]